MNEKIEYYVRERLDIIEECFQRGALLPGLTLLYTAIDNMAWLALPHSQEEVTREDFIRWVEAYMLLGAEVTYSAVDLYAARCAILHTYTAVSRLSRSGQAKKLQYAFGDVDLAEIESQMTEEARRTSLVVHVGELLRLFDEGVTCFVKRIDQDRELSECVNKRAGRLYMALMRY